MGLTGGGRSPFHFLFCWPKLMFFFLYRMSSINLMPLMTCNISFYILNILNPLLGSIDSFIKELSHFLKKVLFTTGTEQNKELLFLDILIKIDKQI